MSGTSQGFTGGEGGVRWSGIGVSLPHPGLGGGVLLPPQYPGGGGDSSGTPVTPRPRGTGATAGMTEDTSQAQHWGWCHLLHPRAPRPPRRYRG